MILGKNIKDECIHKLIVVDAFVEYKKGTELWELMKRILFTSQPVI